MATYEVIRKILATRKESINKMEINEREGE